VSRTVPTFRRGRAAGLSLVEMSVFLGLVSPALVALLAATLSFTRSSEAAHQRVSANASAHRILHRIAAELAATATAVDHVVPPGHMRPHDATQPASANHWYDWSPGGGSHPLDELHDTEDRDGIESWHPVVPTRRLRIYGTYVPFDTIEYQKVRSPADQSHIDLALGTVEQPWGGRRKIFLQGDRVLLRAEQPQGGTRTRELGSRVRKLEFHLNPDGHIVVRLIAAAGRVGGSEAHGTAIAVQTVVRTWNGLH
jgi:hypothetical protein